MIVEMRAQVPATVVADVMPRFQEMLVAAIRSEKRTERSRRSRK